MADGNKNFQTSYRYLSADDFLSLHQTFLEAFSDYTVPFQLTNEQLKNHISLNSVDLERCVGAFSEKKMVGFTLNGFGIWNSKKTVYDAGTGVIPAFRQQGIGKAIFDFMITDFEKNGFEQILLEVISHNTNAIRLYEKLGFKTIRRLIYFEQQKDFECNPKLNFETREIYEPNWQLFETFSDGKPSWQNSATALQQTPRKVVLGVFSDGKFVGYGIFFSRTGTIAQISIAEDFRRTGAASVLLREMRKRLDNDRNLLASNVDSNLSGTIEFLKKCGFVETLTQLEMVKAL